MGKKNLAYYEQRERTAWFAAENKWATSDDFDIWADAVVALAEKQARSYNCGHAHRLPKKNVWTFVFGIMMHRLFSEL